MVAHGTPTTKKAAKPPAKKAAKKRANRPLKKLVLGKMKTDAGLKPNHVRLLCELLQGRTLHDSATAAGLSYQGANSALGIPAFKAAYEQALASVQQRALIDADGLITALIPAATVDARTFFNDLGKVKPVSEWTAAMGAQVASFENDELFEGSGEDREHIGTRIKIKFWPKTDAIDKLAKLLGAYAAEKKDVHVSGGVVVVPAKIPAPETINGTFKRVGPP